MLDSETETNGNTFPEDLPEKYYTVSQMKR